MDGGCGGRSDGRTRGHRLCGEQQFWSGGVRGCVGRGRVRRGISQRKIRPRGSGQIWRQKIALVGESGRKSLAGKWIAAQGREARRSFHGLARMRIRRNARRGGFDGNSERGLREIHWKAGLSLRFGGGFGGLRKLKLPAAVAAGHFSQTFGSGIFLGIDGRIGRFAGSRGRIIFARFDPGAILRGENLRLL